MQCTGLPSSAVKLWWCTALQGSAVQCNVVMYLGCLYNPQREPPAATLSTTISPYLTPCTVLYCTVLHCTVLHSTALYYTFLYSVMHSTPLYYTLLHCTTLYCTLLHCIAPYYTVLSCTTLYYTVLLSSALYYIPKCIYSHSAHSAYTASYLLSFSVFISLVSRVIML